MINNRVAFMSALAFAVLSLFLVGSSEASQNYGENEPTSATRQDPSAVNAVSVLVK